MIALRGDNREFPPLRCSSKGGTSLPVQQPKEPAPDIVRPPTPLEEPKPDAPVGLPEPPPDVIPDNPVESPPAAPPEIPTTDPPEA